MSAQVVDYDPIPLTVEDAVAAWDRGDAVFTVEMGGLGPGYEMAIQALMFELLRAFKGHALPPLGVVWNDADRTLISSQMDAVVRRLADEPWAGFSGAQVGAAKNLAVCILRRPSYREAMRDPAIKDRLIQVSTKDLRK